MYIYNEGLTVMLYLYQFEKEADDLESVAYMFYIGKC